MRSDRRGVTFYYAFIVEIAPFDMNRRLKVDRFGQMRYFPQCRIQSQNPVFRGIPCLYKQGV